MVFMWSSVASGASVMYDLKSMMFFFKGCSIHKLNYHIVRLQLYLEVYLTTKGIKSTIGAIKNKLKILPPITILKYFKK